MVFGKIQLVVIMVGGIAVKRRVILSRGNSFAVCSSARFSSVQIEMVSKRPEKPISAPPRLSEVSPNVASERNSFFSVRFGKRLRPC